MKSEDIKEGGRDASHERSVSTTSSSALGLAYQQHDPQAATHRLSKLILRGVLKESSSVRRATTPCSSNNNYKLNKIVGSRHQRVV